MSTPIQQQDSERGLFLEKLHASELLLTEWEQSFVASYIGAGNRYSSWFTPARRTACDKLRQKFGHEPEIGMPFFTAAARQPAPEAVAGGCMFLKADEQHRQSPCNSPAAWQRANGFRYCQECAEVVQANIKRMGKRLTLLRYP